MPGPASSDLGSRRATLFSTILCRVAPLQLSATRFELYTSAQACALSSSLLPQATTSRGVSFNVRKILRKCRHDVDIYVRLWAIYAFCRPPRRRSRPSGSQNSMRTWPFLPPSLKHAFSFFSSAMVLGISIGYVTSVLGEMAMIALALVVPPAAQNHGFDHHQARCHHDD